MDTPGAFLQIHTNAATRSFAPHRVSDLCRAWLAQIEPDHLDTNIEVIQVSNAFPMNVMDPVVDLSLIRPAERRNVTHRWHQDPDPYTFAPKCHDNGAGSIQVTSQSAYHQSGRSHMSTTSCIRLEKDLSRSPTSLQTLRTMNDEKPGPTRISGRKEAIQLVSPQQVQHHIRRQRGRAPMPRTLRRHPNQVSSWVNTDGSMPCYIGTPIPRHQSKQMQSSHPAMLSGHAYRTNLQIADSSKSINSSPKNTSTSSSRGFSRKRRPLGQILSPENAVRLLNSQSLIYYQEQGENGDDKKSKSSSEGSSCCCIRVQGDPAKNTRISSFVEEQPPSHRTWSKSQLQACWNLAQRSLTPNSLQAASVSLPSMQEPLLKFNLSKFESQSLLSESLNEFIEDDLPLNVADSFRTSSLVSRDPWLNRPMPSLRGGCGCFDDDSSDDGVGQLHEAVAEHPHNNESEHSRHHDSEQLQNNGSEPTRDISTRREQKAFTKGYAKANKIGMEEFQKRSFRNLVGLQNPGTSGPSSNNLSRQLSDPTRPATHAFDSYTARSSKGKERQTPGSPCSPTRTFFSYRNRTSSLPERGRFGSRRTGAPFEHTSLEIMRGLERYGLVQITSNANITTLETYIYSPWHLERELEKIRMERLVGGFSMETVMAFDPTLPIQGPSAPVLSSPGPSTFGPSIPVTSASVQFAPLPSAPVIFTPVLSASSQSSTTSSEATQPGTILSGVNLLGTTPSLE